MKPTALALSSAFLMASAALQAQTATKLTKPDASFPEPFTQVSGVRELPNGKVIVSDMRDKVVQLLDFRAGSQVKVGGEGQGPGEYALPVDLIAMPNGETWVNDLMGRRFLSVDANGKPGRTITLPGSGSGGIAIAARGTAADAAGNLYLPASPFNLSGPGASSPDSLAIHRWKPNETTFDTVAWFVGPKASIQGSGSGNTRNVRVTMGAGKAFTPQEVWGVAADGSIARVIPSPYRVIWYPAASNKGVAGPTQPYSPIKVTDADREEENERRKRLTPMMVTVGGGGRGAARPPSVPALGPDDFEPTKPPFTGPGAVLVAPEGEVWVRRTGPAGQQEVTYDVFDRSGKVARKVSMSRDRQVVGFGKGAVYVVRTDDDDLQHLERFAR
ncbi:MAG: NHL repeat-containing protein [Gemmatimonadales bacterium]